MTGFAQGTVNFGGNDLIANAVKINIFVVRYDENGGHKASATFGTAASIQEGYGIEVLSSGEVLVGGRTSGATNFGGGVVGTTGGQEAVLLRLTKICLRGGKSYGSIDHDIILDLELTPSGRLSCRPGRNGTRPGNGCTQRERHAPQRPARCRHP